MTVDSLGCTVSDAVDGGCAPIIETIDLGPDRDMCPGAIDRARGDLDRRSGYSWSNGAIGPFLVDHQRQEPTR